MDEWINDKQIKELSNKNPEQIYEDGNGRVAFAGAIFENKEQFQSFVKTMNKPPFLVRAYVGFWRLIKGKKKK